MAGDPYEIRVAFGHGDDKVACRGGAGHRPRPTATPTQEDGLTRLLIKSSTGGEIEWSIQFDD